jgi:hypothetical protein
VSTRAKAKSMGVLLKWTVRPVPITAQAYWGKRKKEVLGKRSPVAKVFLSLLTVAMEA